LQATNQILIPELKERIAKMVKYSENYHNLTLHFQMIKQQNMLIANDYNKNRF
jgi:hypothetical protein